MIDYYKEQIDFEYMKYVLEIARTISSDIIVIPRLISQSSLRSCIIGLSHNSIISYSRFNVFENKNIPLKPLWFDPSLQYISLYSKDIPVWFKIMNDNKLQDACMYFHKYIVNNQEISIGTAIEANNLITTILPKQTEKVTIHPTISLYPYQDTLNKVYDLLNKWDIR